jgi:hypothetical protein
MVYLVYRTKVNILSALIFIVNVAHDSAQSNLPKFDPRPMHHNWFNKLVESGP